MAEPSPTDALARALETLFRALADSQVDLDPDIARAVSTRRWDLYMTNSVEFEGRRG